jgi:hypothetical protein
VKKSRVFAVRSIALVKVAWSKRSVTAGATHRHRRQEKQMKQQPQRRTTSWPKPLVAHRDERDVEGGNHAEQHADDAEQDLHDGEGDVRRLSPCRGPKRGR